MTIANDIHLRIRLVEDEGDGERFFTDVCGMIQRIVERTGVPWKHMVEAAPREQFSETYTCHLAAGLPALLHRESGAHRAQLVPAGSTTGRVMTSRVVIEVTPAEEPIQPDRIIKTYNYVLGRVTRHDSGEVLRLEDVLAGRG